MLETKDYIKTEIFKKIEKSKAEKLYPQILSIGIANPPYRYRQSEVVKLFDNVPTKAKNLFKNSHIKYRYLYLPEPNAEGKIPEESNLELINKHLRGSIELGSQAIENCLSQQNFDICDIDHLICVSSTGFLCPGISAYLVKNMNFREDIHRVDIIGMGCNAGINALQCAVALTSSDPKKKALLICIEICSAAYLNDGTIQTSVVNSLFGDGAAAVLITTQEAFTNANSPQIIGFESETIVEKIDIMKFELVNDKLSFYLAKETPYVIGMNIEKPVDRLLDKYGLKKRDIKHWIVHSGGKKVLDSIKYNLGLTNYDIRHTLKVLEEYGNMSSCSIFFSLERLQNEKIIEKGDLGVAIAMGPGTAIESALLKW